MKLRTWDEAKVEIMSDAQTAAAYLKAAIEEYEHEGDPALLMLAIRTAVEAKGGVGALASATGLSRQTLYRTLSGLHNPRLDTLSAILRFCGLSLTLKKTRVAA